MERRLVGQRAGQRGGAVRLPGDLEATRRLGPGRVDLTLHAGARARRAQRQSSMAYTSGRL
jgi:hypothetical protein